MTGRAIAWLVRHNPFIRFWLSVALDSCRCVARTTSKKRVKSRSMSPVQLPLRLEWVYVQNNVDRSVNTSKKCQSIPSFAKRTINSDVLRNHVLNLLWGVSFFDRCFIFNVFVLGRTHNTSLYGLPL